MKRLSKEKKLIFLNIAKEISKASKCQSYKVGCVIVRDGRIISTGYNGSPVKYINCNEMTFKDREEHKLWSDNYEIHSEMNAIIFAARTGVAIEGSDIYSTVQPCRNCTKNIVQAGIKTIYFGQFYDRLSPEDNKQIEAFLKKNDISYEYIGDLC